MAFDLSGNLWLSTCGDRIVRLTDADLAASGDVTPAVVISGVTENQNLAFDATGNLWVASDGRIVRFDAERLTSSTSDAADRTLNVTEPAGTTALTASDLVFDAAGDLWATDFGGNAVFRVAASDLSGTGEATVEAAVRVTLGVTSLIDRPAFDESGGLWFGLGANGVGRLGPSQLTLSSGPGAPTNPELIVTSAELGSVGRVTFFPAAADLPLYHSLP
jgi:ligand-binding sensor domain-containing protein